MTGLDPAAASLDVARRKLGADRVQWILGEAPSLPQLAPDMAVMTGNVAQVIVDDEAWNATLLSIRGSLRPNGYLVFETRDPQMRAWEQWNRTTTFERLDTSAGPIEYWTDLLDVTLPFVSFRQHYRFLDRDELLVSDSTLRFRSRDEVTSQLADAGFEVLEVRDAPDRPHHEFVFVARVERRRP